MSTVLRERNSLGQTKKTPGATVQLEMAKENVYWGLEEEEYSRVEDPMEITAQEQRYLSAFIEYMYDNEMKRAYKEFTEEELGIQFMVLTWMLCIVWDFDFKPETLHTAVSIMYSFICSCSIEPELYQLVGATSIWIASKIEETEVPSISDIVLICKNKYSVELFVECESQILMVSKLTLATPSVYSFISIFTKMVQTSPIFQATVSFLESSAALIPNNDIRPSHHAIAILILAKIITSAEISIDDAVSSIPVIEFDNLKTSIDLQLDTLCRLISNDQLYASSIVQEKLSQIPQFDPDQLRADVTAKIETEGLLALF